MCGCSIVERLHNIKYSVALSRWARSTGCLSRIHTVGSVGLHCCKGFENDMCNFSEGDHIFGLVPLMAARLNGAGGMVDGADESRLEQAEGKEVCILFTRICAF